MAHSANPPKPANQGGKAPAFVQPANTFNKPGPMNTSNSDKGTDPSTANHWSDHVQRSNPGGYGG